MAKSMKMAPADDKFDERSLKLSDRAQQGKCFETKTLWIHPPPSQPMMTFCCHLHETRAGLEFHNKVVEDISLR